MIGGTVARLVARRLGTMAAIRGADVETIAAIPGVGPIRAASLRQFLDNPRNAQLIDDLAALGVRMDSEDAVRDDTLAGLTIVLTGGLEGFTRDQAKQAVEDRGARSGPACRRRPRPWSPAPIPGPRPTGRPSWGPDPGRGRLHPAARDRFAARARGRVRA